MIDAEPERRGDAEKIENLFSQQVLDSAIEVHRTLVANFGQSRLIDGWERIANNL